MILTTVSKTQDGGIRAHHGVHGDFSDIKLSISPSLRISFPINAYRVGHDVVLYCKSFLSSCINTTLPPSITVAKMPQHLTGKVYCMSRAHSCLQPMKPDSQDIGSIWSPYLVQLASAHLKLPFVLSTEGYLVGPCPILSMPRTCFFQFRRRQKT